MKLIQVFGNALAVIQEMAPVLNVAQMFHSMYPLNANHVSGASPIQTLMIIPFVNPAGIARNMKK